MKIRDDLALAAFAVANGFALQTDRMSERGDKIAPGHFDPAGIPHDGLQFVLGCVHVWQTARGWRVAQLQGDRYNKPCPDEFHGKLINALRAAIEAARIDGVGEALPDAPAPDLAEAAQGDTCTGCGRESFACSLQPCPDVIADREA